MAIRYNPPKKVHTGRRRKPKRKWDRKQRQKMRRSDEQEGSMAGDTRGRTQPGSGNSPRARGDTVTFNVVRGEAKGTTKKSRSLKLAELELLESRARPMEIPVMQIEFDKGAMGGGKKRYAVLPWRHLKDLLEAAGVYEED